MPVGGLYDGNELLCSMANEGLFFIMPMTNLERVDVLVIYKLRHKYIDFGVWHVYYII